MKVIEQRTKAIADVFVRWCDTEGYQVQKEEGGSRIKLEISNLKDRVILHVYSNGNVNAQGKQSSLKAEIDNWVDKFKADPLACSELGFRQSKPCNQVYDILLPDLRRDIRGELEDIDYKSVITDKPSVVRHNYLDI